MLYIMRHGVTDWNIAHKLQGRTNVPLNAAGREMAKKAAAEYREVNFDVCFCSPLCRAKETADILLGDRNVPIIVDERLTEMSFGIYEGVENVYEIPDCPMNVFFKHPEEYTNPVEGGESLDSLFKRTGEFLKEAVEPLLAQGKDVIIVGHGAMNSSIVCQVKEKPLSQFWSDGIVNCKLMLLKQ